MDQPPTPELRAKEKAEEDTVRTPTNGDQDKVREIGR